MRAMSLVLALLLIALPQIAQASFGLVEQFLPGGRGAGMAGAYTATAAGPFAVDYNPAALAFTRGSVVGYYAREAVPDLTNEKIGYRAMGLSHGNGSFGLGLFHGELHQGEWVDSGTGAVVLSRDTTVQIGAGVSLFELFDEPRDPGRLDVALGANVKKVRARFRDDFNDYLTAWDIGLLLRKGTVGNDTGGDYGQLRVGIVFDDPFEAEDRAGRIAFSGRALRGGVAWEQRFTDGRGWWKDLGVLIAFDAQSDQTDDAIFGPGDLWAAGAEIHWPGLFAARFGWVTDNDGDVTDLAWSVTAEVPRDLLPLDLEVSAGQFPQATDLDRVWFFGVNGSLTRD